jgi:CD109 antigen
MSLVGGVGPAIDASPIFGVSFLVLASKIMRPGHVYRLMVTNYSPQLVTAHASILRDGLDIASAEQQCSTGVPETIMLRVPSQALDGLYKLKIEGRTETDEVVFSNETALEFSRKSITIFIQTDKPIYKQGQVVKIRTVPITTDLKPFSDALDVYMLDPNGIIVKRWLSKQTNLGSVSIEYPLSDQPVKGDWTIRVFAQGQIQEGHFIVEEYHTQQYEIKVTMPSEFLDTDEFIKGSIMANYTSGAPVSGNLTVVISAEQAGYSVSTTESENKFNGFLEFRYRMQDLRRLLNTRIEFAKITVAAFVGEQYMDLYQSGYAKATISSSKIKLKFIGPSVFVFKPYMTFDCYLAVSYLNGMPLSADQLKSSLLDVRLTAMNKFGSMLLPNRTFEVVAMTPGIWKITIDVRHMMNKQTLTELDHLKVDTTFFERFIAKASASARIYPTYSPSQRSLQITTSTTTAKVGDYAIFHVSSNYRLDLVTYVVITKGLIMTSGRERIKSSPTTFAIPVSAEMVPTSTLLVYDISKNQEVVMDSLTFHVDGTSLHNFTIILNPNKDKHGESLEVAVYGQPGTYVGITAFNQDLYALSNSGQLDKIHFNQQMQDFDKRADMMVHHWLTPDGRIQEILNLPSPSQSVDAYNLLESYGLVIFTDATIPRKSYATCNPNLVKCLIVDKCYNATVARCNGLDDCGDTSDESGCDKIEGVMRTQERLHRVNRLQRLYEDNWLWKDINIGPLGHYIFTVKLPNAISTWSVNAFSMSPQHGIGLLESPIEVSNVRPFLFKVEIPKSCNLGEQIGIRALVSNYLSKEIEVNIILANSPDYKFVVVGESGEVSSYNPETTFGEQQHLIVVKSGETSFVYLPIVAQRLGTINVTVSAYTQVSKKSISKMLHVEADGIPQNTHMSVDLDLSRGSYMIKHLDSNVTESPVVMYDIVRRYIYGSNKASISIAGGVVGPVFPTVPVATNTTLKLPSDCGEQNMFNFAMNLLSISYLRQTGQDTPELKREIFKYLNVLYQKQLSFRSKEGSFKVFKSSTESSVWLTAFVARYLHQATAQEWENYIYIDPDVIDSAITWLVSKQTPDGAFAEQGPFAYDRKLDNSPRLGFPLEDFRYKNVSLTAYVLIALHSVKDRAGEHVTRANNARIMAQRYLESLLHRTTIKTAQDPFDLALVTYALQLVNSIEADEAFVHLEKKLHTQSGLRYWSIEPIVPNNPVNVQNNRNLIYPRYRGKFDSRNVQTTAYGLLTLIQRQIPYQRDVVDWLNTQRLSESGWSSTQDTIVALQALMEYSVGSDHRSVTDIKVSIEAPALRDANREHRVTITEANISQVYSLNIPNAHGIFTVRAEGSGTALLSLDIQYNVDWPHLQIKPAIKAFDLDVRPSYSGRNSSNMNMDICTRWTLLTEAPRSGMAVLEVPIPTGYMISQSVLDKIVNSSATATFSFPRNLKEARANERKIFFYFDYVSITKVQLESYTALYQLINLTNVFLVNYNPLDRR